MSAPKGAPLCWVPPGSFIMGADDQYPEEAPAHPVHLDGFWIEQTPVTNEDFRRFVHATGYRTTAEEHPTQGSAVFHSPLGPVSLEDPSVWWDYVPGGDWMHPDGPDSGLVGREDHPVRHVSYSDAMHYAEFLGRSLPTEAQWEYAARGGLDGAKYSWGDELHPEGRVMANTWSGEFPWRNEKPHPPGTLPVATYPPNGFGLYDAIGQVWEWTSDWYQPSHANMLGLPVVAKPCCAPLNPTGATRPMHDPAAPRVPLRVLKGGSYLCADNYCSRYRPAARIGQAVDSSASNVGFRCVSA